jgi:hypothetical protein
MFRRRGDGHRKTAEGSTPRRRDGWNCVASEAMRAVCLADPARIARWPAGCTECRLAVHARQGRVAVGAER